MQIKIKEGNFWVNNGWSTPVYATVVGFKGSVTYKGDTYISYKLKSERKGDYGKTDISYHDRRAEDMYDHKIDCVKDCLGLSGDYDEALI